MKKDIVREERKDFFSIQDITLVALFAAFITICSFITIPIGPVPFSLQTFGVFVTAGLLGTKRGTISVLVYVLLGLIGVPVFRGNGGIGVLVGVTGGYITGFIFSALIIGSINYFIKTNKPRIRFVILVISMIVGDVVCFLIGTVQFMAVSETNLTYALANCVVPFIIPDLVKIFWAAVFINAVRKHIKL